MTHWGLFLSGYAIGLALLNLVWSTVSSKTGNTERSPTPLIPSAMDDWDEEFKRLTGISPFPEIVIRARVPAALCQDEVTTYSFRDYEARPGDVCYYRGPMGFVVLGNESPGPRS